MKVSFNENEKNIENLQQQIYDTYKQQRKKSFNNL